MKSKMRREWFWLGMIVLLGLVLRLYHLGTQSLWGDEAFSWFFASQPVTRGLELARIDFVQPPLYYLLLHPAVFLSQCEFALRLPSALLGTLSIPLMYVLGRDLDGREGHGRASGLLAASLVAINPFHIWYSREARNYQLAFFLSLLLLYLFQQLLQGRRRWLAFAAVSALAYVTHYFLLLLALVQFLYFLLDFRHRHHLFRRWCLAQVAAVLPLGLWLVFVYSGGVPAMGIGWILRPRLITPLLTLWDFALLYAEGWLSWGVFALLPFALVLLLGLGIRRRRRLLLLWLAVPALTLLAMSWLLEPNFYVDRYLIISLPAFILLLARGVVVLWERATGPRWLAGAVAAVLVVASVLSVGQIYWDDSLAKSDWRGAGGLLEAGYQGGDLVVVRMATDIVPLRYYFPEPEWISLVENPAPDPWIQIEAEARQVWLVWSGAQTATHLPVQAVPADVYSEADPQTQAWLETHREEIVAEHALPGITVLQVGP